jgi:hypothetical protein
MPAYRGPAAAGRPDDQLVHRHWFTGVDVALTDDFPDGGNRERVRALLEDSATLTLATPDTVPAGDTLVAVVTVNNDRTGHSLPSGTSFSRQMWIEIIATTAAADTIYVSGDLDANQDLRDSNSELDPNGDPDLVNYTSVLEGGDDVTVFTATGIQNNLIPANAIRSSNYRIGVPAGAAGPVHVAVRLRFRAFPPYKARSLGHADLVDRIPIFEMAAAARDVVLR